MNIEQNDSVFQCIKIPIHENAVNSTTIAGGFINLCSIVIQLLKFCFKHDVDVNS